jgi:hypothetical protein
VVEGRRHAVQQVNELVASGTASNDELGDAVAISGKTIVVGAAYHGSGAGRAYVFDETARDWRQVAELKGRDTVAGDNFGTAVAVSGKTIVVGAESHECGAGRAYVFAKAPTGWSQVAELEGADSSVCGSHATSLPNFGTAVAVSGNTALVGCGGPPTCAGVQGYSRTAQGWQPSFRLEDPAAAQAATRESSAYDNFGSSLAVSGGTAAVGAPNDARGGRAYVFARTAAGWRLTGELAGSDTTAGGSFGISVAVSGSTVVVGDYDEAAYAGRAYAFTKTPTGWHQVAELKASDAGAWDYFGGSVATSGNNIVVGTFDPEWDNLGVASVAAPPPGYPGPRTGRVYVFTKTAAGWSQTAELAGSKSDAFGTAVGASGGRVVIGAREAASGAGRVYVVGIG